MDELWLRVEDYAGPSTWRWALTEPGGRLVAGHEVKLDPRSWQFEAFTGLQEYLRLHAVPDRRSEDEARILADVGGVVHATAIRKLGGFAARPFVALL